MRHLLHQDLVVYLRNFFYAVHPLLILVKLILGIVLFLVILYLREVLGSALLVLLHFLRLYLGKNLVRLLTLPQRLLLILPLLV